MSVGKNRKDKDKPEAGAERKARLGAELRANLKRRKARSRDARASTADVGKEPE